MTCHFIFYVTDQDKSTAFYSLALDKEPSLNVPGMTEFQLTDSCILGLMPEKGIVRLLGDAIQDPGSANGIPRAEIYLRVSNPAEALARAINAGAKLLSPLQARDWGESAGYVEDPDGHVLAFST